MPLVKPLSNIEDKETQELVTFFNETLGFCPNSVLTMQKKPHLAQAFVNLNKAVMDNAGSISSEFKRIIAYISSYTAGCRYSQAHTIRAAERYGGEKERLEQAWDFENSSLFNEAEKVALRFTISASSVPVSIIFSRMACMRFAFIRLAPRKSATVKSAPSRLDAKRFAPLKLISRKF